MAIESAMSRIEPKHPLTDRDKAGCIERAGATVAKSACRWSDSAPGHHQHMEGVDDSDFRAESRQRLLEKDVPLEQVDRLFSDLPPSTLPRKTPE